MCCLLRDALFPCDHHRLQVWVVGWGWGRCRGGKTPTPARCPCASPSSFSLSAFPALDQRTLQTLCTALSSASPQPLPEVGQPKKEKEGRGGTFFPLCHLSSSHQQGLLCNLPPVSPQACPQTGLSVTILSNLGGESSCQ